MYHKICHLNHFIFFIFLNILFIYDREREAETQLRQRERQAPCWEPNVGLGPGAPGSRPGPKTGTKLLSHPGVPPFYFLKDLIYLLETEKEREREAEGEAGSMQGA